MNPFRGRKIRLQFPYVQSLDEILRNKYGFRPNYSVRKKGKGPWRGGGSGGSDSGGTGITVGGVIGAIVGITVCICCCLYRNGLCCFAANKGSKGEESSKAQKKQSEFNVEQQAKANPDGVYVDGNSVPPPPGQYGGVSPGTSQEKMQNAPSPQNVPQTVQQNNAQTGLAIHNPLAVSEQGGNLNRGENPSVSSIPQTLDRAAATAQPSAAHIAHVPPGGPEQTNHAVPPMMHPQNMPMSQIQHGVPPVVSGQTTTPGMVQHGVPPIVSGQSISSGHIQYGVPPPVKN